MIEILVSGTTKVSERAYKRFASACALSENSEGRSNAVYPLNKTEAVKNVDAQNAAIVV